MKHTLSFIILLLSTVPFTVSAEVLAAKFTPEIPGPHEEVTIKLEGHTIDLDRSSFVWYVDGEPQNTMETGIGRKEMTITTKGIGEPTVIDIAIFTIDGAKFDKRIVINPMDVDLIWEADTYVPPFYRGKALPTNKSLLSVFAVPYVPESDDSSFIYTWKEERFNINAKYSGYKKNVLKTLSREIPLRKIVDVEIKSYKGDKRAKKRVTIPSYEPEIVFYPSSKTMGPDFAHAIGDTYKIETDEFDVRAEPFFMSNDDMERGTVMYAWRYNNKELTRSKQNIRTFTFNINTDGDAPLGDIGFEAASEYDWAQNPTKTFSIER